MESILNQISTQIRNETLGERDPFTRLSTVKNIMTTAAEKHGFNYHFPDEEKPAAGANGTVREMSGYYRINYRCGYGKHNYAPVVHIQK